MDRVDNRQSDVISEQRSAVNLDPHKQDIGNRFSTIDMSCRESFMSVNPLAKSAVSSRRGKALIDDYSDDDEGSDKKNQVPKQDDMMSQMDQFS